MTELVACLSKENQPHLTRLIAEQDWEKVILISDSTSKNDLKCEKKTEFIIVDFKKPVSEAIIEIRAGLKQKVTGIEVALNLVSGSGKEHMAIMSALLKLGISFRFVAVTKDGVVEI